MRLDLAYDGTDFSGWARQPGRRTVQAVVEDALTTALRVSDPISLVVAGRTDAGVHAIGQVAHAEIEGSPDPARLASRLAGLLPADVRARAVNVAPEGFDARFSALSRCYEYRVSDDPAGVDPLRRHETAHHHDPLDVERMNASAAWLIGEHDFAAFCRQREGATTVRRLLRLDCVRTEGAVVITAEADAFCHSMVRALVGALLAVGAGRRPPEWPREVLGGGVRDPSVRVAPAHGLTLVAVRYPPDEQLATRAGETRSRRSTATEARLRRE